MTDRDRLLERLRGLDPVRAQDLDRIAREETPTKRRILALPVDDLARRRVRRRRAAAAVAAAVAAAALLIPLVLLLPLSDGPDRGPGGPGTVTGPSQAPRTSSGAITVTAPAPGAEVSSPVRIEGDADVFEATVSIRIVDATGNIVADTFTTATCGSGCRGDFAADVGFSVGEEQPGVIQVFEVSAQDGSRINTVRIPVTLVPGPGDPVAAELEGTWTDPDGRPVPDGTTGGPVILDVFEGPDHCGWTSVSMLGLGWPIGTPSDEGSFRMYVRDPDGVLGELTVVPFDATAQLPSDAVASGYRIGDWELWSAASDRDQAVYVVNEVDGVEERWGRSDPPIGCA